MKTIFATHCSKDKVTTHELISAVDRYISPRIRAIYNFCNIINIDFYILSGEYGLIKSDTKIRYYDHLLQLNEIDNLTKIVKDQIIKDNILNIIFFTNDPLIDNNLCPYLKVINNQKDICKVVIIYMNNDI